MSVVVIPPTNIVARLYFIPARGGIIYQHATEMGDIKQWSEVLKQHFTLLRNLLKNFEQIFF